MHRYLKKIIIGSILLVLLIILILYWLFLFRLPQILNSDAYIQKYERILTEKLGTPVSIKGFKFTTKPNLHVGLNIDEILLQETAKEPCAYVKNLDYGVNLLNKNNGKLDADYIYVDVLTLKSTISAQKNEEGNKFKFNKKYLPTANIKKADILLDKNFSIKINNINSYKKHGKIFTDLDAKLSMPYTKKPIVIGKDGQLIYGKDFAFDNFSIQLENSKLYLSGELDDIKITGKNLPVNELEKSFLYYYKIKYPNKKNFLENFDNFEGTLDVDLTYTKDGLNGYCIGNNLKALFWTFKIPVKLPKTLFEFSGRQMKAKTTGTFGADKVDTDVFLTGIATKNLEVNGNVSSNLTNNTIQKYYPDLIVKGTIPTSVKYNVKNSNVKIDYQVTVPKGSDIFSEYGNLSNVNTYRQIKASTLKNGDNIKLTSYDYVSDNKKLMSGNGDFSKQNGKYKPIMMTFKTNGRVPVMIFRGFIDDYVSSGDFDADFQYEFANKILNGYINFYNVPHKNYLFLQNGKVVVKNHKLQMNAEGTFFNSPISASLQAQNSFKEGIVIDDIDIHLKEYFIKRGEKTVNFNSIKTNLENSNVKNKTKNIYVKKGHILVDKISHRKFTLQNVEITGNLKDNIANFVIPQTIYAQGILSAKGKYNVLKHNADIHFFASDIDSNEVVTNLFGLPNQVEGKAFATMHLITKDKLNDIKAQVEFGMNDGYLPQLGSTEFFVGKSKKKNQNSAKTSHKFKFTLSKITNLDFSKRGTFYSNLYGGFMFDNEENIKNAKIYSKSDYLSMFIEGDYNVELQNGLINIWGRHNKTAAKKVKIFKIPITLIYKIVFRPEHSFDMYKDKINQIPEIKSGITDIVSTFRVQVEGNLNSDDKKIILKDLR